jgi:hypothetical protein
VCTREHRCVHEQARSSISTTTYHCFTDAQPPPHRPRPPHTALPERSAGRLHRLLLDEATRVVALPVRVREEVVTPCALRARLQNHRASRYEWRAAHRAARQSRELGEAGAARHAGRRERAPPERRRARPAPRAPRRGARLADPRERVDRLRPRSHAVSHNSRTMVPFAERRGRARSALRAGKKGGRPGVAPAALSPTRRRASSAARQCLGGCRPRSPTAQRCHPAPRQPAPPPTAPLPTA